MVGFPNKVLVGVGAVALAAILAACGGGSNKPAIDELDGFLIEPGEGSSAPPASLASAPWWSTAEVEPSTS
jgi:hypothetical protein